MILEFALGLTLVPTPPDEQVILAEFREPVTQVEIYPPTGEFRQLSGLVLTPEAQGALETEFLPGTIYFGAFAITKDFGWGWVTGANSLEAAREIAIEECLKHGDACLIYAEIVPPGYQPPAPGIITLAPEAMEYYSNPDPSWGRYRAMAVSEDGAYSITWNYGTAAEAEAAALADCTANLISDLPNLRNMPCVLLPFK